MIRLTIPRPPPMWSSGHVSSAACRSPLGSTLGRWELVLLQYLLRPRTCCFQGQNLASCGFWGKRWQTFFIIFLFLTPFSCCFPCQSLEHQILIFLPLMQIEVPVPPQQWPDIRRSMQRMRANTGKKNIWFHIKVADRRGTLLALPLPFSRRQHRAPADTVTMSKSMKSKAPCSAWQTEERGKACVPGGIIKQPNQPWACCCQPLMNKKSLQPRASIPNWLCAKQN